LFDIGYLSHARTFPDGDHSQPNGFAFGVARTPEQKVDIPYTRQDQCVGPLSLSRAGMKSGLMRGRSPAAGLLQTGQGLPAPPHMHERATGTQSASISGWFSQTQPVSSQSWQRGDVMPLSSRQGSDRQRAPSSYSLALVPVMQALNRHEMEW
jgi:hypothetical protein